MLKRAAALAVLVLVLLAPVARGQQPIIMPSGPFLDASTSTLGATSTQILAAVPNGGRRSSLFVELNTASATVACTISGGAAVIGGAGSITISGQYASLNFSSLGAVPNTALNCIADAPSRSLTVLAFPQ